ncbi:MAG TPA: haloacid dehalogenase type II [Dehalococcoidia bacterium]|jgi:2-haloacid dehalogenase|nr:haloacid dehalogenase type II [Dehalococcoidia bacterium]
MTTSFNPLAVKAMVFDTFGTVVDWRGSIIAEGNAYWTPIKKVDVDWAAFADSWRGKYGPFMNKVRSGELPWTKLDDLHRMSLNEVLDEYNVHHLTEPEKQHLNFVWHRLNAWPDAPSGLARLKSRYIISPLSNGNLSLLTEMAKFAGLPWDCILGSDVFKHYKPDPETYLGVADILGIEPGEVMMTAAHTGDLDSARKVGLRTAYVHRPIERPGREPAMPAPDAYDVVATDFRDMASKLGL